MALKVAQTETQLDVDQMILDFLIFEATQAVLEDSDSKHAARDEVHPEADLALNLYHNFLPIFKCNHPQASAIPDSTRFRSRLLYFSTLFLRRFRRHPFELGSSELQSLRYLHRRRAALWWESFEHPLQGNEAWSSQLPATPLDRDRAITQLQTQLRLDSSKVSTLGKSTCISLLDLIPMFVALSAAARQLQEPQQDITSAWMHLAAEFMLQAVIEQWSIYEAGGPEKIGEAFAWGWLAVPESEWPDEHIVNDMFCEDGFLQEVEGWTAIKETAINMLRPPPHTSLALHLDSLSKRYPITRFQTKVAVFLDDLHQSQDEPILTQVEMNRIKGLSMTNVLRLKDRARWPA